jgi:hypothetical protein
MPKSLINGPKSSTLAELNSSNTNLPNSRSSSYQRKFVDNIANNGSIKIARTNNNTNQKTPTQFGLNQTAI